MLKCDSSMGPAGQKEAVNFYLMSGRNCTAIYSKFQPETREILSYVLKLPEIVAQFMPTFGIGKFFSLIICSWYFHTNLIKMSVFY